MLRLPRWTAVLASHNHYACISQVVLCLTHCVLLFGPHLTDCTHLHGALCLMRAIHSGTFDISLRMTLRNISHSLHALHERVSCVCVQLEAAESSQEADTARNEHDLSADELETVRKVIPLSIPVCVLTVY